MFDLCTERARQTDWAAFVPAKQGRVVRFEIVDEEEWRERLHGLLGGELTAETARRAPKGGLFAKFGLMWRTSGADLSLRIARRAALEVQLPALPRS